MAVENMIGGLLQDPNVKSMIKTYTDNLEGGYMAKDTGLGGLGAGLVGGLLSRMFMGNGLGAEAVNHGATTNEVQSMINSNQANNNSMLLLKDIQDSTAEVIAGQTAASNAAMLATMNAEIANLQGQGAIKDAIGAATVNLTAQHALVNATVSNGNTAIMADLGNVKADIAHSAAASALATAEAKYQTLAAITASENAIRTDIRDLKDSIPNARELDLQRQLGVALSDHRHTETRRLMDSGNVSVATNVNQAQAQQQQQVQVLREIDQLRGELQRNTQSTIAIGSTLMGNAQTATNVRQ